MKRKTEAVVPEIPAQVRDLASRTEGLDLLLLHGSRARGDSHEGSDWDFGWIGGKEFDLLAFWSELTRILQTDAVDLADLCRANAVLRFRAASEGVVVHESRPDAFHDFWFRAVTFWYDVRDVIKPAREQFLAELG